MYSPKIKEELIPILHKLAKQERIPMTKLVDEMLRAEIAKRNGQIHPINKETAPVSVKKKLLTMKDLKCFLEGKFIVLDCGHRFCLHPLSNNLVLIATGHTYCRNCYD